MAPLPVHAVTSSRLRPASPLRQAARPGRQERIGAGKPEREPVWRMCKTTA
jgi:hypothetical protein